MSGYDYKTRQERKKDEEWTIEVHVEDGGLVVILVTGVPLPLFSPDNFSAMIEVASVQPFREVCLRDEIILGT